MAHNSDKLQVEPLILSQKGHIAMFTKCFVSFLNRKCELGSDNLHRVSE